MNEPSAECLEYFNIVQKCLLNGILVREWVDNYLYPAMAIFSRPARHRSRSGEAGGRYL